jgi:putative exosortase-associated protein (TIGR04073 family)
MKNNLFKIISIMLIISFLFTSFSYAGEYDIKKTDEYDHGIPYCLGRGVSNILLGWLELPSKISYQSSEIPFFGFFSGAITGVGFTIWRALSGVSDILTFGLGGGNIYLEDMPDFPWNVRWAPEEDKKWTTMHKKEEKQEATIKDE